ncbi:kinase-like domain-containing protein [Mycena amicta]|nr:kinase-like domain-containing protein [Mycena amicta]
MMNQIIRPQANDTDFERDDAVEVDPSHSTPRKSTSSTSVSFTGAQEKPFLADESDDDGPHTPRDIDLPSAEEDTPTRAPSQLPRLETDAIHGKAALIDSDVELLPSSAIIAPQKNDDLDQPVIKDVALATSSTSTEPAAAPRFVPRPGSSSSSVGNDGSSEFASENSTLIPQTLTSISPAPLQVNGQHPTSATPVLRPASPSPAQQEDTREEDTWAPRPPPDDIYKRLEEFFPEHDLDEPVIEAASAPDSNDQIPGPVQRSPAATAKDKGRDKKSIRIVAQERKKYGDEMTSIQRKRSTKLWGNRLEEVDTSNLSESPSTSDVSSTTTFKWVRGELIGRGTYGRVYLALNATTGEMIAVKQVETPRTAGDKSDRRQISIVQALKMESETLKDLDHPNIVQYLGFEETPSFLSMQYVPGGSIGSCLLKYGKFEEDVTKSFISQILTGLEYLHSKGVIHRDLKSDNILVEISGVCKISDFGTSKRTDDHNDTHTAMQGTVYWMAPEVVGANRTRYNTKIDIWSIGCLLLEMWTGASGDEIVDVMIKLYQSKLPPLPDGLVLSQQADDFRGKCFAINPDERSTAAELRDHPYLTLTPGWVFDGFKRQRAADTNSKQLQDYHANGSQSLAP